ncbi:MAG: hypothetical protein CTY18_03080 [Methylomonas sp.]|nr:MAG: hypothetical protein CTY18_03080 [Methylomonas sp.]
MVMNDIISIALVFLLALCAWLQWRNRIQSRRHYSHLLDSVDALIRYQAKRHRRQQNDRD